MLLLLLLKMILILFFFFFFKFWNCPFGVNHFFGWLSGFGWLVVLVDLGLMFVYMFFFCFGMFVPFLFFFDVNSYWITTTATTPSTSICWCGPCLFVVFIHIFLSPILQKKNDDDDDDERVANASNRFLLLLLFSILFIYISILVKGIPFFSGSLFLGHTHTHTPIIFKYKVHCICLFLCAFQKKKKWCLWSHI